MPLCWGTWSPVLGFSLVIYFPPHPPYFSRVVCIYSQRKQLLWPFLVAWCNSISHHLARSASASSQLSLAIRLKARPSALSSSPCSYLSLCIAKTFVTEIRDTICPWLFMRNWLRRGARQPAHQLLRMVGFNLVSSPAMETSVIYSLMTKEPKLCWRCT